MAPKRQFRRRNHEVQNAQRSMLLEDFRAYRYPNLQLADIVSHVVEFCRDHDGSKFLQRKLDDATDQRKESIFCEMLPMLVTLMMDPFANFVVQKFIDVGNDEHHETVFSQVETHFMKLSLHKYGCRVVQKAVENASVHTQIRLLQQCAGENIVQLAKDANGNHVIQRSFRFVTPNIRTFLFEQIRDHITDMCFDLYGCRVVQCILEHGTVVHRSEIINQIYMDLERMVVDRYGNYVIQHAIQYSSPVEQNRLINHILKNAYIFSMHKYASNVVEKCINFASPDQQDRAVEDLCHQSDQFLRRFCTETYANYVVQKIIDKANIRQLEMFYTKIVPYFHEMGRHKSGRKIINKTTERLAVLQHQISFPL